MENEIIVLQTQELELIEKSKADQIKKIFNPMAETLKEFEGRYDKVVSDAKEEITIDTIATAKRLRLDIGRVRIDTDKLRKEQKDEYLRAGRAIDGVANILKWAISEKEDKLKEIEKHFEIQEQKRLEDLQIKRVELLAQYFVDAEHMDLSSMQDEVWTAYFSAKKKEFEDRVEAERKAEKERVAKEKAEKEEQERIKKENEQLKKDAEEKVRLEKIEQDKQRARYIELKPYIVFIRDYPKMLSLSDKDYEKELETIKRVAEDKWEHERKELREKERIQKKEILKREKLEAELKEKKQLEITRVQNEQRLAIEKEKFEQDELNKGDAAKVKDLIRDLEDLKTRYSFKSVKNKKMYDYVVHNLDTIIGNIM